MIFFKKTLYLFVPFLLCMNVAVAADKGQSGNDKAADSSPALSSSTELSEGSQEAGNSEGQSSQNNQQGWWRFFWNPYPRQGEQSTGIRAGFRHLNPLAAGVDIAAMAREGLKEQHELMQKTMAQGAAIIKDLTPLLTDKASEATKGVMTTATENGTLFMNDAAYNAQALIKELSNTFNNGTMSIGESSEVAIDAITRTSTHTIGALSSAFNTGAQQINTEFRLGGYFLGKTLLTTIVCGASSLAGIALAYKSLKNHTGKKSTVLACIGGGITLASMFLARKFFSNDLHEERDESRARNNENATRTAQFSTNFLETTKQIRDQRMLERRLMQTIQDARTICANARHSVEKAKKIVVSMHKMSDGLLYKSFEGLHSVINMLIDEIPSHVAILSTKQLEAPKATISTAVCNLITQTNKTIEETQAAIQLERNCIQQQLQVLGKRYTAISKPKADPKGKGKEKSTSNT